MQKQRSLSETAPRIKSPILEAMSMEDMFKMATRNTTTWGIEGYEVPNKYIDPLRQIQERDNLKIKKGQKDKRHVTKRGHYLDDLSKITKQVPGPSKYDVEYKWADPKDKLKKPNSAPHKRQTFIDDIFKEQKLRGIPGTGKYNLIKPLEEIKKEVDAMKSKKIKQSDRPNFLNDYQYHSNQIPGPGNYNPREITKREKLNTMKQEQWISKHKEQEKKRNKSALPDVGTYKPHPSEYVTFGRMLQNTEEKRLVMQRKIWGQDERFKDPKKSKSISSKNPMPGPGQYSLICAWQGKEEGIKKQTKKSYLDLTSKGPNISIYY